MRNLTLCRIPSIVSAEMYPGLFWLRSSGSHRRLTVTNSFINAPSLPPTLSRAVGRPDHTVPAHLGSHRAPAQNRAQPHRRAPSPRAGFFSLRPHRPAGGRGLAGAPTRGIPKISRFHPQTQAHLSHRDLPWTLTPGAHPLLSEQTCGLPNRWPADPRRMRRRGYDYASAEGGPNFLPRVPRGEA